MTGLALLGAGSFQVTRAGRAMARARGCIATPAGAWRGARNLTIGAWLGWSGDRVATGDDAALRVQRPVPEPHGA